MCWELWERGSKQGFQDRHGYALLGMDHRAAPALGKAGTWERSHDLLQDISKSKSGWAALQGAWSGGCKLQRKLLQSPQGNHDCTGRKASSCRGSWGSWNWLVREWS